MSHADVLLTRLESVKQTGPDKWLARCPAHEDRSPSLSIAATSDGTILLHCFAGCGAADIVTVVGLAFRDLFPDTPTDHRTKPTRPRIDYRAIMRAIAHEAIVVSLFLNSTNGALTDDDRRVVNRALGNIIRMGGTWK